jgi:hypothetical protein
MRRHMRAPLKGSPSTTSTPSTVCSNDRQRDAQRDATRSQVSTQAVAGVSSRRGSPRRGSLVTSRRGSLVTSRVSRRVLGLSSRHVAGLSSRRVAGLSSRRGPLVTSRRGSLATSRVSRTCHVAGRRGSPRQPSPPLNDPDPLHGTLSASVRVGVGHHPTMARISADAARCRLRALVAADTTVVASAAHATLICPYVLPHVCACVSADAARCRRRVLVAVVISRPKRWAQA